LIQNWNDVCIKRVRSAETNARGSHSAVFAEITLKVAARLFCPKHKPPPSTAPARLIELPSLPGVIVMMPVGQQHEGEGTHTP